MSTQTEIKQPHLTEKDLEIIKKVFCSEKRKELIVTNVTLQLKSKDDAETFVICEIEVEPVEENSINTLELEDPIEFNSELSVNTIKNAIRASGYLDKYSLYYVENPSIIIKNYTVKITKEFSKFKDFKYYAMKLHK